MFNSASFDPATLRLLSLAFDEAWIQTQFVLGGKPLDPTSVRTELAKRIIAAANAGERDPVRLKLIALRALND